MNIVRFNPWRELDALATAQQGAAFRPQARGWLPPADVSETPTDYRIELEIPAVAAEDVEIQLEQDLLTISGERKRPGVDGVTLTDEDVERADAELVSLRSERRYGRFSRRFRLPEDADPEAVSASTRDGVLHLVISKRVEKQPRRIEIHAA